MKEGSASRDVQTVAEFCRRSLPFELALGSEYGYKNLPLCVLDAVWSIGVRYTGVQNVIARYQKSYGLDSESATHSVNDLIENIQRTGASRFATEVVCNSQRTSTRGGILKSEAVLRFALVLKEHQIQLISGLRNYHENRALRSDLSMIPGQGSGISIRYFFMLAGDTTLIKPDRMTLGFLSEALRRQVVDFDEAQDLIAGASMLLKGEYPTLTPRDLDHEIWKFQRQQLS
jgi:hypothetical protein